MTSTSITHHPLPFSLRGENLSLLRDRQGLTAAQRHAMTLLIVALHLAAVYGLLQVREVRETVREAAPMFVDWIVLPTPEPPPPEAPKPRATPQSMPKRVPVPQVLTAAPSPEASTFSVAPPEPAMTVTPPSVLVSSAPAPAPVAVPKIIPASAVEYLVRPDIAYPRQSIRNHETGTVVVRVYVDTAGLPRLVEVGTSSGSSRLDEAALAGVRKSRFKPYTEDGRPTEGWVFIPVPFELEK